MSNDRWMETMNTPPLETNRLILRKFSIGDLPAIFDIFSDKEANEYLPWFPLESMEQALALFERRYEKAYKRPQGYDYAICLKENDVPIGYVNASIDEGHDFGYGLRREFWHRGIAREAGEAVIERLRDDGMPYITATHDVNNPRSGAVMRALGMRYRYSYEELWQPKNLLVTFRMYQMNLDGNDMRVFRGYWDMHPVHFIEDLQPASSD